MNTNLKEYFTKIYTEYADSIFRYCILRVSDRQVAIDLVQDVFVRYWNTLTQGKHISNDKAFLFTITRNIIIDWYRKKKPLSLEGLQEEHEDTEEFMVLKDDAASTLELGTEARFIMSKLKDLPHTSQQVLYLRYVEDLKTKEIAEVLDINENAVSVRIHRGLEELRKITGYDIPE